MSGQVICTRAYCQSVFRSGSQGSCSLPLLRQSDVSSNPSASRADFSMHTVRSSIHTITCSDTGSFTPRLCNYRIADTFSGTRYSYLKYVVRLRLTYTALHSMRPIAHATFSPTAVHFPAARQLLLYWYQCHGTETFLGEVAPG